MPALRARIGELFGGRIAAGVDPMTIVARGAALYAGSVGLDARPAARGGGAGAGPGRAHRASVRDRRPRTVRGRPLPARGGPDAARSRAHRARGRRQCGRCGQRGQCGLAKRRRPSCRRRAASCSRCAWSAAGATASACAPSTARRAEVALATRAFAIVHGVSIGDPPLARAIGVARADDSTHVYFPKGTPLPARRTFVHHTVKADRRGQRRRRAGRSDRAGRVDPRAPQPSDRDAAPARASRAICPPAAASR